MNNQPIHSRWYMQMHAVATRMCSLRWVSSDDALHWIAIATAEAWPQQSRVESAALHPYALLRNL